ncbi:copper resistance protein CopZ [Anaerobacillus alkalidiazotrophicus]|uniref:Copper chaperone CopZ n=1 Tax=Anaerobacillus alkalidiazotrophicus TaxID=472963 RepID=A0A1S2M4X3_9BACI|nr:copper ion binding protein [Anaerobacillus alkalidiazotrophicus]OIJ18685.1 copper resistance protein CopZ [Anaerobacillus alkalidiazotrophicus]
MKKVEISVRGMSCGHCVSTIEGALTQMDGVSSAKVNLEKNKVTVNLDTTKIHVLQIEEVVNGLGYNVGCHQVI